MSDEKPPYKVVHDLDLGEAAEFPLSVITINLNGYEVLAPPVVYQCPKCFATLPHKFDAVARWIRIKICQRHKKKEAKKNDSAT